MRRKGGNKTADIHELAKVPSGIKGLDVITGGGLPKRKTITHKRGPGVRKTLFAMEFIIRGITDYNDPGVSLHSKRRSMI